MTYFHRFFRTIDGVLGREVWKLKIFPHLRSETPNIESEKSHNGMYEYDGVVIPKSKSCFSILQILNSKIISALKKRIPL